MRISRRNQKRFLQYNKFTQDNISQAAGRLAAWLFLPEEVNMEKEINGTVYQIPQHVAIILDGNGRWAKKHFMPRNVGHSQGAKTVE